MLDLRFPGERTSVQSITHTIKHGSIRGYDRHAPHNENDLLWSRAMLLEVKRVALQRITLVSNLSDWTEAFTNTSWGIKNGCKFFAGFVRSKVGCRSHGRFYGCCNLKFLSWYIWDTWLSNQVISNHHVVIYLSIVDYQHSNNRVSWDLDCCKHFLQHLHRSRSLKYVFQFSQSAPIQPSENLSNLVS